MAHARVGVTVATERIWPPSTLQLSYHHRAFSRAGHTATAASGFAGRALRGDPVRKRFVNRYGARGRERRTVERHSGGIRRRRLSVSVRCIHVWMSALLGAVVSAAAIFVHGIFSSHEVWLPLITRLGEDPQIAGAYVFPPFEYSSPKVLLNRKRRRPDLDMLADWLRTFLKHQCADHQPLVLIGHSQGGLVIQRYLARMLADGRGGDLRRIRSVVLLACPNDGSDFMLTWRRRLLGSRNVQELQLRAHSEPVKAAQARVINQIVNARHDSDTSCHIPFHVFYGMEDRIVPVASARGPFPEPGALPGDHSTILAAAGPNSPPIVTVVRNLLLTALRAPSTERPPPDRSANGDGVIVVGSIPGKPTAFVTRETADRLARVLDSSHVAVVCALTGMRGVGKTQLAAAYARSRVASVGGFVAWVNADTHGELLAGLAELARRLGVGDPEGDSLRSALRLRTHLAEGRAAGLLVFDNATDRDRLCEFLPTTGATQIVITSTDRAFTSLGEAVDVERFDRQESQHYLGDRTGYNDAEGAVAVAKELIDLPLALASAAATILERGLSYRAYLDRLRRVPLSRALDAGDGNYPRPVMQALLLSAETAEADDPTGLVGRLLGTMSVLSPDGVTRQLLHGLAANGDAEPVEEALRRCARMSVLSWSISDDSVIMHRLVARALRERAGADNRFESVVTDALGLLEAQLFDETEAWQRRQLGSHLVSQIEALWNSGSANLARADLVERAAVAMNWAVRQLVQSADLARSVVSAKQTLADCERVLGPDHPDTLTSRNNLAGAYESAGRLSEAIPLYEQTLAERERVPGPDHPDTLASRNNLAGAYRSVGRLSEAIPLYEQTLADYERILGPDHPDTLTSRNNLAAAYESVGRLSEAIPLYEQTLAQRERVLGPDHPDTLTSRNNLAYAYRSAGRLSEAIPLYEQTLAERERVPGPDHPDTLRSRNNLAGAYRSVGRLSEAIPLYEQTLADYERILGPDHPDTLTSRNNLAAAYESAGRLSETIPLYEQTLAQRERVLGPDHPDTLTSRNNLAYAYESAGRLSETIPLYEQTLADYERVLGPDHPDTLTSRNNLACAYQSTGRLSETIPLYEQTLAQRERVLGPDHPDTLTSRNNLACAYQSAGRLSEAIPLHEQTLAEYERVLGPDHPATLTSRNNLAGARRAQ
jgi:tetratricopeptide (TPR) repeat protein/pimeloyl-ACP methyl ester carboxylesterase